jgi:hypothetical protein
MVAMAMAMAMAVESDRYRSCSVSLELEAGKLMAGCTQAISCAGMNSSNNRLSERPSLLR